jgi:hypothetical protein
MCKSPQVERPVRLLAPANVSLLSFVDSASQPYPEQVSLDAPLSPHPHFLDAAAFGHIVVFGLIVTNMTYTALTVRIPLKSITSGWTMPISLWLLNSNGLFPRHSARNLT